MFEQCNTIVDFRHSMHEKETFDHVLILANYIALPNNSEIQQSLNPESLLLIC